MTDTAQKLIAELKEELEKLPEAEQERRIASYLEDLRQRKATEELEEDPYSALKILRDAKLSGSTDASVSSEKEPPEIKKS